MRKIYFIPIFFIIMALNLSSALALDKPASSLNPVGSGARALGMGGAFIGVADDATAASWNPGGLVQLKEPEVSVVGNWFHRIEDNTFGPLHGADAQTAHHEADGPQSVSGQDINYFSIAYPFHFLKRNMIVSLTYQHLYDFTRQWSYPMTNRINEVGLQAVTQNDVNYQQTGSLSALGLSYCVQVIPNFFFGFTLNFWNDDLLHNKWKENFHVSSSTTHNLSSGQGIGSLPFDGPNVQLSPSPIQENFNTKDTYSFSGFNANLGCLWRATEKLTIGMVFKSPFTAELKHKSEVNNNPATTKDEKMDMPMSYGLGVSYRFSDQFTISADIYRTEWQDFIITENGEKKSFITRKPASESDIDPTHQFRIGAEYLLMSSDLKWVIPLRAGAFYDPAPAEGSPDDYYGLSLGAGITMGRYLFDIACQYRFGDKVSSSMFQDIDFHQNVDEYTVYSSLIIHF